MILRELFYFDKISTQPGEQKQYDPSEDQSIIKMDDTRKTRLSLKQINKARKAGEFHKDEQEKELVFVRQMYGASNQPEV
jgi:hypothetical protein|tara:strand:- start:363 stop:602 length:240 start_codon:yes stop_codon:yes gene_type:complete